MKAKIDQTSIKNRSKIEPQHRWPLGIDFWCILVGFGMQVGMENRAKRPKKSIEKRIEKKMKKRCDLDAAGGGGTLGRAVEREWRGSHPATP